MPNCLNESRATADQKSETAGSRLRDCLAPGCKSAKFMSVGPHDRVCPSCRETAEWLSAGAENRPRIKPSA